MRMLWNLIRHHPAATLGLGLVWAASWVPIWMWWTTGIEPWMLGVRYAVLLFIGAFVGVGLLPMGRPGALRGPVLAGALVSVADVVVLFIPDLAAGLSRGDPWWGFAEAAVFALLLGSVWAGIAGTSAGLIGSRLGIAMAHPSKVSEEPI